MRMSISTTVGSNRAAFSTASLPLLASATTSMSSSTERSMRKPARTIDWSSATSTPRIVTGLATSQWKARVKRTKPPSGAGPADISSPP